MKRNRIRGSRPPWLEAERPNRWNPAEHLWWLKSIWGRKVFKSTDAALAHSRADKWEPDAAITGK